MYILVWFWFVLILLGIVALIVLISLYNTLIHLQMTCGNTAQQLCSTWIQKSVKIPHSDLVSLINTCKKASTTDKQVLALNKLRTYIIKTASTEPDIKKLLAYEKATQTEKRFFNNTARELTERLTTFPTKFIWSFFDIQAPKLFDLDEDTQSWILPEAKYL